MKTRSLLLRLLLLASSLLVMAGSVWETSAAPSVVNDAFAGQRAGSHQVDIYDNVSRPHGNWLFTVPVVVSAHGGANCEVPVFTPTGAGGRAPRRAPTGRASSTVSAAC